MVLFVATIALVVLASLVLLLALVLAVEVTVASDVARRQQVVRGLETAAYPSVAVLIPAHNEEGQIEGTIRSIQPQLREQDRIVVVADNCSDATADVARQAGAEVVERRSETARGKGYALAAGVERISCAAPGLVAVVDADTMLEPGTVASLANAAAVSGRPVQAVYLMNPPDSGSPRDAISAFAFLLKNHVRPLGAQALGIPAYLTGTGMVFPWSVISQARLATGNIVEDMQLGMDLAITGAAPQLCTAARVVGTLPSARMAATTQRTRWEHGHMQTILHNVPRLVWACLRQGRLPLAGLALDLAVPPLALLVSLWFVAALLSAVGVFTGVTGALPLQLSLAAGGLMAGTVLLAWVRFARGLIPIAALLSVPFYIAWKIPVYAAFLFKREKSWVRTARK